MEKNINEWKDQIENQQLLVRDIIDIDSTYEDFEATQEEDDLKINKKLKSKKEKDEKKDDDLESKKDEENSSDDDEFNVHLAKMEEEIKPKIINILESLTKIILNLRNIKLKNLECFLASKELISFKK